MQSGAADIAGGRLGEDAPVLLGKLADDPAGHAGE
jgi:hypothetical protein